MKILLEKIVIPTTTIEGKEYIEKEKLNKVLELIGREFQEISGSIQIITNSMVQSGHGDEHWTALKRIADSTWIKIDDIIQYESV